MLNKYKIFKDILHHDKDIIEHLSLQFQYCSSECVMIRHWTGFQFLINLYHLCNIECSSARVQSKLFVHLEERHYNIDTSGLLLILYQ